MRFIGIDVLYFIKFEKFETFTRKIQGRVFKKNFFCL